MLALGSKTKKITNRLIVTGALAQANLSHSWSYFKGTATPKHRLGKPLWAQPNNERASIAEALNLCIFVIYSSKRSLSTLSYLQAIKDAGFTILAINNAKGSKDLIDHLKPLCWRIYERQNIGRDIGAFKDGIMQMQTEGLLEKCHFLCLANDSMQFIPGVNGQDFTARISKFIKEDSGALFSHQSHQMVRHYQSYFQILDNRIITSDRFNRFWRRYRPLSHREHCIHRGELELSQSVYNNLDRVQVLYTPESLLSSLKSTKSDLGTTAANILGAMPSITRTQQQNRTVNYALEQLTAAAQKNVGLDVLCEHYLCELIEQSNPSHVAAFLYPFFLKCPLIKHDLCFAGSFSIGKAISLFQEALSLSQVSTGERETRTDEFRQIVNSKGIPSDYQKKPISRALKGVVNGFEYTAI